MVDKKFGIVSLGILLTLGILNATIEQWEPPTAGITNVTQVDEILAHAESYEEYEVTIVSWIHHISVTSNNTIITFTGVTGDLTILIPYSIEDYEIGDSIAIKGISYVISKGYILANAIHKINFNLTIGFSIIAGLIFLFYFFNIYTIDAKLNFKRRK